MDDLTFTVQIGGKQQEVTFSPVQGGGGIAHLYIKKYYYGQFGFRDGKWELLPQNKDYFTPEEIEEIERNVNLLAGIRNDMTS